jgi:hypothetical protein
MEETSHLNSRLTVKHKKALDFATVVVVTARDSRVRARHEYVSSATTLCRFNESTSFIAPQSEWYRIVFREGE